VISTVPSLQEELPLANGLLSKGEISSTFVHHVTPANTQLRNNLSTHRGGESKVLSVLAALKALDGDSPIHVDGFFDN